LESELETALELVSKYNFEHGWGNVDEHKSKLDQDTLKLLKDNYSVESGRVTLPCLWKRGEPDIASNFNFAKTRLETLMKGKHMQVPGVRQRYSDLFSKWEEAGIIKRITVDNPQSEKAFYWPHFPVMKPGSETTKVRPVFDGAAKCLPGKQSINDKILAGPKLINELSQVLLRFRARAIAFVGDVEAMFLQVKMPKKDARYHRFLWYGEDGTIIIFEFDRHLFGNAGSPTIAIFAVKETALKFAELLIRAAECIAESTIVDDNLDSVCTDDEAIQVILDLNIIYGSIGMKMRKIASNSTKVLKACDPSHLNDCANKLIQLGSHTEDEVDDMDAPVASMKTLGVGWNSQTDTFGFDYNFPTPDDHEVDKMKILSISHSIYDPLGFTLPYIMYTRFLLQKLWQAGRDWHDPLSKEELESWHIWLKGLPLLKKISVPRVLFAGSEVDMARIQLHVFADASDSAYAAVGYIRQTVPGAATRVTFTMARSKIKPSKMNRSVPKLELMGIHCACDLALFIAKPLKIPKSQIYIWSDSMTALHWTRMTEDHTLQLLVHNYRAKIRNLIPDVTTHIRWVPGIENPADVPTRGKTAEELVSSKLWFQGPDFLKKEEDSWPVQQKTLSPESSHDVLKEVKRDYRDDFVQLAHVCIPLYQACIFANVQDKSLYKTNMDEVDGHLVALGKASQYARYVRIMCYVFRFFSKDSVKSNTFGITVKEFQNTELKLCALSQKRSYPTLFTKLRRGTVPHGNMLFMLDPFLDSSGIIPVLRLRGRLKASTDLPYGQKFPLLLGYDDQFTVLLVRYYHEQKLAHTGGIKCLLSELHTAYWVIGPVATLKKMLSECVECRKVLKNPLRQQMGPYPNFRLPDPSDEQFTPFKTVAIDAAGPWHTSHGRAGKQKRWLLIIRCCNLGCIWVEMLYEMTTDSFLLALDRFVSRWGRPEKIISDNGTNFVGGANALEKFWNAVGLNNEPNTAKMNKHFQYEIAFSFIPPFAPHFNGLIERYVGAAKVAIAHILPDNIVLTDEALHTFFIRACSYLNNRPLGLLNENHDPNDLEPITPNHFMIRKPHRDLVPGSFDEVGAHKMATNYKKLNALCAAWWRRYTKELIPCLRKYTKWQYKARNVASGDIVLVLNPSIPETPMGLVIKAIPGADGLVRRAIVKVDGKQIIVNIHRLCLLIANENSISPKTIPVPETSLVEELESDFETTVAARTRSRKSRTGRPATASGATHTAQAARQRAALEGTASAKDTYKKCRHASLFSVNCLHNTDDETKEQNIHIFHSHYDSDSLTPMLLWSKPVRASVRPVATNAAVHTVDSHAFTLN
jgi:hypothetical protein